MSVATNDAETAEGLKAEGNQHFAAGRFDQALEAYERAIAKAPLVAIYYCNASACCAKLDEFGKAVLFADEALRLDPAVAKGYFRRAVALMGLQQWKGALQDLRTVAARVSTGGPPAEVTTRMRQCERELQKIAFARAIHVEQFELDMKHIRKLTVDPSYEGPRLADDAPITWDFVQEVAQWSKQEKRLHPHFLYRIAYEALQLFRAAPTVVDICVPPGGGTLTVCGDIHGQYFDLLHLFETNGYPSAQHTYLFNGDLVDRGPASIEVLLLLFALKALFPHNMFIARGNHESESVNRMHGFYEEVQQKYPRDSRMFTLLNSVLHALPLVHIIQDSIFVVHGGLPATARTLTVSEIQRIDRTKVPEPGSVMNQLLWSDPQDAPGIAPSHRGEGILFGPDVTEDFLRRNGLSKIIRSHVWEPTGYREQHDGKCITIFSAPNYTGTVSEAAVINLDEQLTLSYRQFSAAEYQGKAPRSRAGANFNSLFPS